MKKLWIAAVLLLVSACGQETPAAPANPPGEKLSGTAEFKAKYAPLFELHCLNPSCYVDSYKPTFDRLPQDLGALPNDDQLNLRTRITDFSDGVDKLIRAGCVTTATDSAVQCKLNAMSLEADVDFVRNYVTP